MGKPQLSLYRILYSSQLFKGLTKVCNVVMGGCAALIPADHCWVLLPLNSVVKLLSGCENDYWLSCSLLSVLQPSSGKCCWSTWQAIFLLCQSWPPLKKKVLWRNTVTFIFCIYAWRICQHGLVAITDFVVIYWFNRELYLWCADLALLLAWFMSSYCSFINSFIPTFYFNFIEYYFAH